jgi:8-oxo-dGTP diphosphatase
MTIQVAMAVLYRENKFLMQLRDKNPNIVYPGYWGLFGGHMESGETPEDTVKREILEEIGYVLPPTLSVFGCYPDEKVIRHVFHAPLMVKLDQLVLNEGWDMSLVTLEEIYQGSCYSAAAGEVRPLGPRPQRILLDFINRE